MRRNSLCLGLVGVLLAACGAWATAPTAEEMSQARKFATARFETAPGAKAPERGLVVVANHDAVQRNARGGKPMRIGDKEYTRGLYCHAPSHVIVRLPGPGKTLRAVIAVDSNDQTRPGHGSIVFSVDAGEKELFRSNVMREGMPGQAIAVELGGADELALKVSDSGDGISCDQADWVDAEVVLSDGKSVWLGDLPIVDERPGLMDVQPPFSFTYGGKPSSELLPKWKCERASRKLDNQRTEHTVTYTDPESGLVLRCVAIEYHDYPVVEWTLHFKNTGKADTPILEKILPLDVNCQRNGDGEFLLHHGVGSQCSRGDFQPLETPMGLGTSKRISAAGGRSTNTDLSYFNLQWAGEG